MQQFLGVVAYHLYQTNMDVFQAQSSVLFQMKSIFKIPAFMTHSTPRLVELISTTGWQIDSTVINQSSLHLQQTYMWFDEELSILTSLVPESFLWRR